MKFRLCDQSPKDWDRLAGLLPRANRGLSPTDQFTTEYIAEEIARDRLCWYVVEDDKIYADIFAKTFVEDGERILHFPLLVGRDMRKWTGDARKFFTALAQHNHCTKFRLQAQDAQARLYRALFPKAHTFFIMEETIHGK